LDEKTVQWYASGNLSIWWDGRRGNRHGEMSARTMSPSESVMGWAAVPEVTGSNESSSSTEEINSGAVIVVGAVRTESGAGVTQ